MTWWITGFSSLSANPLLSADDYLNRTFKFPNYPFSFLKTSPVLYLRRLLSFKACNREMGSKTSTKLLKSLRFLNTSSSSISAATGSSLNLLEKSAPPSSPAESLKFDDGERLFSSTSTSLLLNSTFNLHIVAFDPIVDVGILVMRSSLMENKLSRGVLLELIKRTVYSHFCAGEDVGEASQTLQRLWDIGLRGILDHGLEDASDNEGCDQNLEEFLNTIKTASLLPPSSVSFVCVKITAICPISLLERATDLLRWKQKNPSFNLPWELDSLPVLCNASPLFHTTSEPPPLTDQEEQDLRLALQRLMKLCEKCSEINLPLLIDAEYTSVQPAIDYFTYTAAIRFNSNENPMIYGTIQAYLIDAKERLVQAIESAERRGISMGFKLVRGAYMTRETQLANSLGVASPIHPSIQDTHKCYNECSSFMLEKIAQGNGSVVLATHNLESGKVAAAKAEELRIGKGNQKLQFSQLKGMADVLSSGLRNAGFNVSKYLPFGPVEKIIPYLLRRAEENRGPLSASSLDRELMKGELKRRLKVAITGG